MNTNFVLFGICIFGGMIIGALLTYGCMQESIDSAVNEVYEENFKLKKQNARLTATLRRFIPDQSLWGFTKGDKA